MQKEPKFDGFKWCQLKYIYKAFDIPLFKRRWELIFPSFEI